MLLDKFFKVQLNDDVLLNMLIFLSRRGTTFGILLVSNRTTPTPIIEDPEGHGENLRQLPCRRLCQAGPNPLQLRPIQERRLHEIVPHRHFYVK